MKPPAIAYSVISNWLSRAVQMIISFALVKILLERLGVEGYGTWVLVGSIIGYFFFLELGIGSATVRYLARSRAHPENTDTYGYFSTSCIFFLGIAATTLLITLILTQLPPNWFNIPANLQTAFRYLIMLCGLSIALSFVGTPFSALLRAHERFDILNIIGIITNTARFAAILIWLDNSPVLLGGIQVFASLTNILLTVLACNRITNIPWKLSAIKYRTARAIIGFSMWSFIVILADLIRFKTDAIVISYFIGTSAVAVFHIGHRLLDLVRELLVKVGMPMMSRLSALATDTHSKTDLMFTRASRIIAFCVALATGFMLGSGIILMKIWVGDSLNNIYSAYCVMVILAIPAFLDIAQVVSVSYFYATAKHNILAWTTLAEAVGNIIISIALAPYYGIFGVAIGTAIPMFIIKGFILPYYTHKLTGIPMKQYLWECLIAPAILIYPLFTFLLTLVYASSNSPLTLRLAAIIIVCLLYSCISGYLYFSSDELHWMRQYLSELLQGRNKPSKHRA